VLVPAGTECGREVTIAGAVDLIDPGSQPGEALLAFVAGELPLPGCWRWLVGAVLAVLPGGAGRDEVGELGCESDDLLVEAVE